MYVKLFNIFTKWDMSHYIHIAMLHVKSTRFGQFDRDSK